MKRLLIYLFLFSLSIKSFSQGFTIKGTVLDAKDKSPLIATSVVLLNPADSSLVKGVTSDLNGGFLLDNISAGSYVLKITSLGYNNYIRSVVLKDSYVNLGSIELKKSSTTLKEINIVEQIPPSTQKGDTTQYNAKGFKTNPDANAEDLINKMPGITSDNGQVKAQGENIQQVLVDGKPFFGNDPNAALKNLPAEVIDKIQIFDKKSDQAQFSGFDDGNSVKTLNIVTKTEFRNGQFGKIYAGGGNEEADQISFDPSDIKYKSGLVYNSFDNDKRLTVLGISNNVNEQNFSSEDLAGVISSGGQNRGRGGSSGQRGGGQRGGGQGGSGGGGGFGGNDASNFLVNTQSGIATTNSIGFNFSNSWKAKEDSSKSNISGFNQKGQNLNSPSLDFTGSYFFNSSKTDAVSTTFRQYVLPSDSGLTYDEANVALSKNINHRLNLKFDYKLDSMNSLLVQPRLSFQTNDGSSNLLGENNRESTTLNQTHNDYSSDLKGKNFSSLFLYRHRFEKKGRTISLSVTPGYTDNDGSSNLDSRTIYYSDATNTDSSLNQHSTLNKQGMTLNSNLAYTEPTGEKSQLQFNYRANINNNESDKQTYNFSSLTNDYNDKDSSLSNVFKSNYLAQSIGTSWRRQSEKAQMALGLTYQNADLKTDQQFPSVYELNRNFQSILPNAMFQYKFSQTQNLRAYYRSSNNAPSVEQLQEVLNNTNPLQLTIGNAGLEQDFQNNLVIRYSSSNVLKSTTFFALIGGSYINNYIGNSTTFAANDTTVNNIHLQQGSQLTQPVNLNGYYSLRSFLTYGVPIKKIKSNFNLNFSGTFSRTPGLINSQLNYASAPSFGLGVVFSSNVSEKIDFTVSSNSTLNYVKNTIQTQLNTNYFNQATGVKFYYKFWKGFLLQTDLTKQNNQGLSASYNQDFLLWNAALAYKFLKNDLADIRLSVFDLLSQNRSINRNTTDTYIEDVQTNVLQRYFLLTFTYNIKNYKNGKKE